MADEGIGQTLFGAGFRFVFGIDAFGEDFEFQHVFGGEDLEGSGESVGAAVL